MNDESDHQAFLDELDHLVGIQQAEKQSRVTCDKVDLLHQLVPSDETSVNNVDVVAIELCVLSVSTFSKGWHYQLTNKAAAGPSFQRAKAAIEGFEGGKAEQFLFHLTVWQPAKRRRDDRTIPPGQLLFSDGVTGFSLYKLKRQGEATHESVMKTEFPATKDAVSKRARLTNGPAKANAASKSVDSE